MTNIAHHYLLTIKRLRARAGAGQITVTLFDFRVDVCSVSLNASEASPQSLTFPLLTLAWGQVPPP